jgi:hypothetical protein
LRKPLGLFGKDVMKSWFDSELMPSNDF